MTKNNHQAANKTSRINLSFFRPRLAVKFLLIFIPFLCLFSLGTFFLVPEFYKKHGLEDMANKARSLANIASYSAAPAIFFEDIPTLEELLQSLARDEDLLFALIRDEEKRELVVYKKFNYLNLASIITKEKDLSPDKKIWLETTNIIHQDKPVGQLILGFSLESLLQGTRRVQRIAGLASLVMFLLGLLITYYLSYIVTKPLRHITTAVTEIAAGDFDRRVEVSSSDEVGLLASSFNKMLNRLAETMHHLHEARANLEKKVEERTAALQREIAEREQAEQKLRASEDLFRNIVETLGEGVVIVDGAENFLFDNQAANRIFGSESQSLLGRSVREFTTPDQFAIIQEQTKERKLGKRSTYEVKIKLPDGAEKTLLVTATPRFDEKNQFTSSLAVLTDITEIKKNEEALRKIKSQLEKTVEQLARTNEEANLFMQMGDALQMAQNEAEMVHIIINYARRLFSREAGSLYLKKKERGPLEQVGSWGEIQFLAKDFWPEECWALRKGQMHFVEDKEKDICCPHLLHEEKLPGPFLCAPLISFGEYLGVLVMVCCQEKEGATKELAEREKARRQNLVLQFTQRIATALSTIRLRESLKEQSIRDTLTGLYNRRFLEETLEKEIHRASRSQTKIAVMMLDIDYFKQFNDLYGHDAGDAVLQAVAGLLQKSVRQEDIVCRYGGEEFIIIMPGSNRETARQRAGLILERMRQLEIRYQENTFRHLTISIGLAQFPDDGNTVGNILWAADQALLAAKKQGRDRLVCAEEMTNLA